ncbi:hypothetical protein EFQ99_01485 [Rhizobium vallis]|uniref:Uncharacterized protein n=1 Tax=Rhizobium vallis TaxID=634290 RepID=A0A3S0QSR2_9HYPH|nr:hypothetical protein [Rhizobium vallis]RUM26903.1 hypothetical protein EFQ99_01485 [Rhizobium vallis]
MDEDTVERLNSISWDLHTRALALMTATQDRDMAMIMSALAVTMEAVQSIDATVNKIDGPCGLGASGD